MCRKDASAKFCYATETHWLATTAGAWRSEESDHSPRRQTVDSNGQGQSFHLGPSSVCVEMIRKFRRRLSFWSIVNRLIAPGYQSRRPVMCPRLTLDHKWRHHGCDRRHRMWGLGYWKHCVSLHTVLQWLPCSSAPQARSKMIDACILPMDGNHGPSAMGAIKHDGRSETGGAGWNSQPPICFIRLLRHGSPSMFTRC